MLDLTGGTTKGNIVFLGDAIHATTPNLGQGAGMAIESALTLAQAFTQKGGMETVYSDYQHVRHQRVQSVIDQSWKFGTLSQLKYPIQCLMRNILIRTMSIFIPEKMRLAPILKLIKYSIRFDGVKLL